MFRSALKKLKAALFPVLLLAALLTVPDWSGYNTSDHGISGQNPVIPSREKTGTGTAQVKNTSPRLPLYFEENRGQAPDAVAYLGRGRGFAVALTQDGATFALQKPEPLTKISQERRNKSSAEYLTIQWENARRVQPVGESPLTGKVHYFIGRDPGRWRKDIPTYRSVRYPGLYPGIDLVLYGNAGQPEYDFIVAPGFHPETIRLRFTGARSLSIGENGGLNIATAAGTFRQAAPLCYQIIDGKQITRQGRYTLDTPDRAGFHVDGFDPQYPLVIDPVLLLRNFSSYLGGTGADVGFDIDVDSSGNTYIAGRTASTDFPVQGAFQGSLSGGSGSDAFVSKVSLDGSSLVYSTYIGGTGFDEALSLSVDGSGQAHITGRTTSTDYPTQSSVQGSLSGGAGQDAFVTKLNTSGAALVFSSYLGGTGTELGNGIDVDSSGNVYIVGQTDSTNFPVGGGFQGSLSGGSGNDAFLSKITSSGLAFVYSTYLGGTGEDGAKGVAVDSTTNVYVTGSTTSTNFPTQSAFQNAIGDGTGAASDAFITKFNSTGSTLAYSSYLGGSAADVGNAITVDGGNRVLITGRTASTDFPIVQAEQATLGGGSGTDAFVARLLADGSAVQYATYLGGSNFDEGLSIAVDSAFSALVAGRTDSTDFPVRNELQRDLGGGSGSDGFATRYNNFGNLLSWSTYLGGSGTDQATGIAVDSNLMAYVTGFTGSSNFPTQDALQSSLGGGGLDAFFTRLELIEVNPELASSSTVISPYYQVSPGVYSFIGITHPSLAGMNSQIGIRAVAYNNNGLQFGTATEFTVDAGETARLFFVPPNHATLNPGTIPNASFIVGSEGSGRVRFAPVAREPTEVIPGGGVADITMLSFWGAVVVEEFLSGFAVTFIGDLQNSASHPGIGPNRMPSGVN